MKGTWGLICLLWSLMAPLEAVAQERHIRMVEKLDRGEVVFGASVAHRTPEGAVEMSRDDTADFLFYDMEHSTFDVPQLRTFLQFLLSPAATLARGRPGTEHPVVVRIPANAREMNQWMIKNILDQGAHGILTPFVENAAQAENAVRAIRYPQRPDAVDPYPPGERGSGPGTAVRLWGVTGAEYRQLAEPWPLGRGELLYMALIENEEGVRNIRKIAQVPGVSVIFAASGDLSSFYNGDAQAVENALQTILQACLEFEVPCGIPAGAGDVEERIRQGFQVILGGDDVRSRGHAFLEARGREGAASSGRPGLEATEPGEAEEESAVFASWDAPRFWEGVLPCAHCSGVRTTLELRPDGVFRREDAFLGLGTQAETIQGGDTQGDTIFGSYGRWAWEDGQVLRLRGSGESPGWFRVTAEGQLRMLDLEGQEVESGLNYTLAASSRQPSFRASIRLNGAFIYFADSALLLECVSGVQLPVAMTEGYLALEQHYMEASSVPMSHLLVRLRGRVEEQPAVEGNGREETFVVESMGNLPSPSASCPVLELQEALAAGVWTLEEFLPVGDVEGPAFPTLSWDREEGTMAGSGGCNRYTGSGALRGSFLYLGPLAVTRRMCPALMEQEARFLGLLSQGGSLRLGDDGSLVLFHGPRAAARFRSS